MNLRGLVAGAALVVCACLDAQETAMATLEDTFQLLRTQETETQWVNVKAKTTTTTPKETIQSEKNKGVLLPVEDSDFEGTMSLWLAPDKWRYEDDGQSFDLLTEKFVKRGMRAVFDGPSLKSLEPKGRREYPLANVTDGAFTKIPQFVWSKALFLLFRPIQAGVIDQARFRIGTPHAFVNDVACFELQQVGGAGSRWSVWLTTDKPFSVLRYSSTRNGKIITKCDFYYDDGSRWPSGWDTTGYDDAGRLTEHVVTRVTELNVGKEVPPEKFELAFPVGTVVQDLRKKGKERSIKRSVILEEGKSVEIKGETKAAYRQLIGAAGWSFQTIAIGTLSLSVVVGVLVFAQRRFRKEKIS